MREKKCFTCNARPKSGFCNLSAQQVQLVHEVGEEREFEPGEPISFKSAEGMGFLCIRSGYLKTSHTNMGMVRAVRISGPGEIVGFGKEEAIREKKIFATALGGPAKACFISYQSIYKLGNREPEILAGLLQIMAKHLAQSEAIISGLSNHYLKTRVATILCHLDEKFGTPSKYGSKIGVNIDRKTLSEMAGTVVESTARVLTEFESENLITREGRSIHIVNRAGLQRFTNG